MPYRLIVNHAEPVYLTCIYNIPYAKTYFYSCWLLVVTDKKNHLGLMSVLQKLIFGRRNWGSYNITSLCCILTFLFCYQKTWLAQNLTCLSFNHMFQPLPQTWGGYCFVWFPTFPLPLSTSLVRSQFQGRCVVCHLYSDEALRNIISTQNLACSHKRRCMLTFSVSLYAFKGTLSDTVQVMAWFFCT